MEKDDNGVSGHVEKSTNGVSGHMERFPPPIRDNTWLDRKLKPTTYKTYYPFVGKPLLYLTSVFVSLGDGLFGYDQGIISGLLVNDVFVRRFFSDYGGADGNSALVNPTITGITVGCLQLSAATGSMMAGRLGDIMGRKACISIGATLYFIAAFIQAFAPNLACFIVGRTIQGFGVGFLSVTVPIIQTEIAAAHRRGLMVGIEYTFNIAGYMLSTWVDYGFHFLLPNSTSWQGPYFVQMSLAFLLLTMSFILPETPRWLARNGFVQESVQTIADLHSKGNTEDADVQHMFLEIQEAVRYEQTLGQCGWGAMFTRYRKRTIVGITAQMFAQLNGINVISFYLPSTLSAAGFTTEKSLLYTAANALPYTAATITTWWLADAWGRRPLLILGGFLMATFLTITCAFEQSGLAVQIKANGIYAFVLLYNVTYGFTWGPMPWLLPAEIFPLICRTKGMALSTTSNWLFNFIIGMSTPNAFASMHGYYYILIACFCLFSAGLVFFYYVETANHTLEEIAIAFGDKAFIEDDETVVRDANLSVSKRGGPSRGGSV